MYHYLERLQNMLGEQNITALENIHPWPRVSRGESLIVTEWLGGERVASVQVRGGRGKKQQQERERRVECCRGPVGRDTNILH